MKLSCTAVAAVLVSAFVSTSCGSTALQEPSGASGSSSFSAAATAAGTCTAGATLSPAPTASLPAPAAPAVPAGATVLLQLGTVPAAFCGGGPAAHGSFSASKPYELLVSCDGGAMQIQETYADAGGMTQLSSDPVRCPGASTIASGFRVAPPAGTNVDITVFPNGAVAWSVVVVSR